MLYIKESNGEYRVADEDDVIYEAIGIYNGYLARGETLDSPNKARDIIKLKLVPYEYEVFLCLLLDSKHRVIGCEELFRGTINSTQVYPREVVKTALRYNAAALIFAHNHPSGIAMPSEADKAITEKLKQALSLIDIHVLDHLIVGETVYSFAEHGLI